MATAQSPLIPVPFCEPGLTAHLGMAEEGSIPSLNSSQRGPCWIILWLVPSRPGPSFGDIQGPVGVEALEVTSQEDAAASLPHAFLSWPPVPVTGAQWTFTEHGTGIPGAGLSPGSCKIKLKINPHSWATH